MTNRHFRLWHIADMGHLIGAPAKIVGWRSTLPGVCGNIVGDVRAGFDQSCCTRRPARFSLGFRI